MISGSAHDVIYLAPDFEDLAEVLTEDDIVYLLRCGVLCSTEFECLYMHV
jgi:hypothetical protein